MYREIHQAGKGFLFQAVTLGTVWSVSHRLTIEEADTGHSFSHLCPKRLFRHTQLYLDSYDQVLKPLAAFKMGFSPYLSVFEGTWQQAEVSSSGFPMNTEVFRLVLCWALPS